MDDGELIERAAVDPNLCPDCHVSFTLNGQGIRECGVCGRHPVGLENLTPSDYEELLQQNATQRDQIRALEARIETLASSRTMAERDIGIIVERVTCEAEEREWCDEFDGFVDVCNRLTSVPRFEPRTITWHQTLTVHMDFSVKRSQIEEACNETISHIRAMGELVEYSDNHDVTVQVNESRRVD